MEPLILFAAFVSPSPAPPTVDFSAFTAVTPDVRPVPITPKMEYRLIDGKLFYVPADSPWSTPTTPYCPDGRCPLPNR